MKKLLLITLIGMLLLTVGCGGGEKKKTVAKPKYPVPAVKPSAFEGKRTYVSECLKCHGEKGDGLGELGRNMEPPPSDFRRNAVVNIKPYEYYNNISAGRDNTAMQPYKNELNRNTIWDLVYYLWSFRTSDVEVTAGKGIYEDKCVSCHGETGDGQGAYASENDPPPTVFTDMSLMAGRSDEQLATAIRDGVLNTGMSSFENDLDEAAITVVIAYIRRFNYDF